MKSRKRTVNQDAVDAAAFTRWRQGLARDTRVRRALEEAVQPCEVRLVSFAALKQPAHLALHPCGKIPTYQQGGLALFETGSIVPHPAYRRAFAAQLALYAGKPPAG